MNDKQNAFIHLHNNHSRYNMKTFSILIFIAFIATSCLDQVSSPQACMQFAGNYNNFTEVDTITFKNCSQYYDSVNWYLDNKKISNSETYLKLINVEAGYHNISIEAFGNTESFSTDYNINVEKASGNVTFWGKNINSSYRIYIQQNNYYSSYSDLFFWGSTNRPDCNYDPNYSPTDDYTLSLPEGTYNYKCVIYYAGWGTEVYGTFTILPQQCVFVTEN